MPISPKEAGAGFNDAELPSIFEKVDNILRSGVRKIGYCTIWEAAPMDPFPKREEQLYYVNRVIADYSEHWKIRPGKRLFDLWLEFTPRTPPVFDNTEKVLSKASGMLGRLSSHLRGLNPKVSGISISRTFCDQEMEGCGVVLNIALGAGGTYEGCQKVGLDRGDNDMTVEELAAAIFESMKSAEAPVAGSSEA